MSVPKWAGARVRRLVDATLAAKGRTCHLCGLPGANSADHNPTRSDLIRAGIYPDAMRFLFPSHLACNIERNARPITDELRGELRANRLRAARHAAPRTARLAERLASARAGS